LIRINTDVCLGIETASELPTMLSDALVLGVSPVILVDHNLHVGSDMGESARPVIEKALAENKVDTITGVGVTAVDERSVTLSSGHVVPAATVVCGAPAYGRLPLSARLFAQPAESGGMCARCGA
jgi:NADH dehydrogenase